MTKYEKISIVMGGVALLLAVVSPIATYLWLDPQLQSFRHRGRLQVNPILRPLTANSDGKISNATVLAWLADGYEFEVANIGELPAKDVNIVLQYSDTATSDDKIAITPPLLTETTLSNQLKFVTLKNVIGPGETVRFNLSKVPKSIWVSNEFGERTLLSGSLVPFQLTLKDGKFVLEGDREPIGKYIWDANSNAWLKQ